MTRGNNRQLTFHDDKDYRSYLKFFDEYRTESQFELLHYCLMPNHVHLMLYLTKPQTFSRFMKRLNQSYCYYYRQRHGGVGHFWQDRYRAQIVGGDRYFIQCGKYIELNPVRGGLTRELATYPYSSSRYYVNGITDRLITPDPFYIDLGEDELTRQKAYSQLLIDDLVLKGYQDRIWASEKEKKNQLARCQYWTGKVGLVYV